MKSKLPDDDLDSAIRQVIAEILRIARDTIVAEAERNLPSNHPIQRVEISRPPEEPMLTKRQVAELLNISVRSVDKMIRRRAIPYCRLGKIIRFRRSDIFEDFDRNRLVDSRTSRR
jgi:excisionase family DNA binding protein